LIFALIFSFHLSHGEIEEAGAESKSIAMKKLFLVMIFASPSPKGEGRGEVKK
jgi:hypothetical protein